MVEAPKNQKEWVARGAHSAHSSAAQSLARPSAVTVLFDVFPERGVEAPCNEDEDRQEKQHAHANADAAVLCRLTHPLQVVHQIANCLIVLHWAHGAGRDLLPPLENLGLHAVLLGFFEDGRSEERRVGKECRSRWWPYH